MTRLAAAALALLAATASHANAQPSPLWSPLAGTSPLSSPSYEPAWPAPPPMPSTATTFDMGGGSHWRATTGTDGYGNTFHCTTGNVGGRFVTTSCQ